MSRAWPVIAALALALLFLLSGVGARQAYQDRLPNGARVVRNGVPWPAVGHLDAAAGGGGGRNTFGIAFEAAGSTWTSALCHADTDGDGFSNGAELGDPECVWVAGGSAVPERSTGISHPAFSDSFPEVTTPSFRIVGPEPGVGVLQARVFPKPWGAVNFPYTTTAWAREYCAKAGFGDATMARVWTMVQRPAEDRQYLPPGEYVAISDVLSCQATDMLQCAFTLSDVASPQNTTAAVTAAVYVDCVFKPDFGGGASGGQPADPSTGAVANGFFPVRLRGSDIGRGTVEVRTRTGWALLYVDGSSEERFVCERLLNLTVAPGFSPTRRYAGSTQSFDMHMTACTSASVLDCPFVFRQTPLRTTQYDFYCNVLPPSALTANYTGPTVLELVATTVNNRTQGEFAAAVAAQYPGLSVSDVVIRLWQEMPAYEMTYFSLHISSATANPNAVVRSIATTDKALFRIIEHRYQPIADPLSPPRLPDEFRLVGPAAHEGVLQARYGAEDWALVQWSVDGAWAPDICNRTGNPTTGFIPLLTRVADMGNVSSYMPATDRVVVSDPSACIQSGNWSSCTWVHSPSGQSRESLPPASSLYVNCRWNTFPQVRLTGPRRCFGSPEIRIDGVWHAAATDFTDEELCELAGCTCQNSNECRRQSSVYIRPLFYLRQCDWKTDVSSCRISTRSPTDSSIIVPQIRCDVPQEYNYPGPGRRQRYSVFTISPNATKEQVASFMAAEARVAPGNVTFHSWEHDNHTELVHVNASMKHDAVYRGAIDDIDDVFRATGFPRLETGTYDYFFFASNLYMRPLNTTRTSGLELKLDGPNPWEGFVVGRLHPTDPWGKVMSRNSGTLESTFANTLCNFTGHWSQTHQARIWYRTSDLSAAGVNWTSYASSGEYVAFDELSCPSGSTSPDACSYVFQEDVAPNVASLSNYAIYVDCRFPAFNYRLMGAFPGSGLLEAKLDGEWRVAWQLSTIKPEHACQHMLGLPQDPEFAPRALTSPRLPSRETMGYVGDCPFDTPLPKCPIRWYSVTTTSSFVAFDCVEPPANPPFFGKSVRQLSAALSTARGFTKENFTAAVAQLAGLPVEGVLVSQWITNPRDEINHVTLSVNATGLNVGVFMQALMANASFGWLESALRLIPAPEAVPTSSWTWTLERQAGSPTRGFVAARPTVHYPFGVPCARKWTRELTHAFCRYVLQSNLTVEPTFTRFALGEGVARPMYLEQVLCPANTTTMTQCSYAYAAAATAECDGSENVLVDCAPRTDSASLTVPLPPTPSVSRSIVVADEPTPRPATPQPTDAGNVTDANWTAAPPFSPAAPTTTMPATSSMPVVIVTSLVPGTAAISTPPAATNMTANASLGTSDAPTAPHRLGTVSLSRPEPRSQAGTGNDDEPLPPSKLPDELKLEKQPAAASAAAAGAAAGTAMAALGGPADMSDMQTLALASALSCSEAADEKEEDSAGAKKARKVEQSILQPFPGIGVESWPSDLKVLLSSTLAVVLVAALHGLVTYGAGVGLGWGFAAATHRLFFPSISITVLHALSQGMFIGGFKVLLRPEPDMWQRAFAGVLMLVVLAAAGYLLRYRLSPQHIQRSGKKPVVGFLRHIQWNGGKSLFTLAAVPVGFWAPCPVQRRFSAAFCTLRPPRVSFVAGHEGGVGKSGDVRVFAGVLFLLRPMLFGLVAGIPFDAWGICEAQYGMTFVVAVASGVATVAVAPFRWAPASVFSALASFTLALFSVASIPSIVSPSTLQTMRLETVVVVVPMVLLGGKVCAIIVMVLERGWKHAMVDLLDPIVSTVRYTKDGDGSAGGAPRTTAAHGGGTEAPLLAVPTIAAAAQGGSSGASGSSGADDAAAPVANPLAGTRRHAVEL